MIIGFIIIVIAIVWYLKSLKQLNEVVGKTRSEMVDKYLGLSEKYKKILICAAIVFAIGVLLWNVSETSQEETYTYWFFGDRTGTKTVLTGMGWTCILIIGLGGLYTFIGLISYSRYSKKYREYNSMSDERYCRLQIEAQDALDKENKIVRCPRCRGTHVQEIVSNKSRATAFGLGLADGFFGTNVSKNMQIPFRCLDCGHEFTSTNAN